MMIIFFAVLKMAPELYIQWIGFDPFIPFSLLLNLNFVMRID